MPFAEFETNPTFLVKRVTNNSYEESQDVFKRKRTGNM